MLRLLLRDLGITALCLGAFALDASTRAGSPKVLSGAVAIAAGMLAAVVGFLVHEWGHLAGAMLTKSAVYFPERITSVFLFHFDNRVNDRRQFLAMSLGGFAASVVSVVVLLLALPLDALSGKIGLGLAGLGVLATLVLEVPDYLGVLRGGPMPTGFVYEPFDGQEPKRR